MEYYRYVIQNANGQFYWKGNVSSMWGLRDNLEDAYLFKTESSARTRIKTANMQNCTVRKIKIELVKEGV